MRPLLCLCLAALASACATSSARFPRPIVLAEPDLSYQASFRPQELQEPETTAATDPSAELDVRFRLLDLSLARAQALEGERVGPAAWRTRQSELPAFAAEEIVECPSLLVGSGGNHRIALTNQRAYVAAFELSGDQHTLVADPVVDLYSTGFALELSAERVDTGVSLTLDVLQSAELAPPSERKLALAGFPVGITVQVPEVFTQRLRTRDELAPDECLVLSWNRGTEPERRLVLLVAARDSAATETP